MGFDLLGNILEGLRSPSVDVRKAGVQKLKLWAANARLQSSPLQDIRLRDFLKEGVLDLKALQEVLPLFKSWLEASVEDIPLTTFDARDRQRATVSQMLDFFHQVYEVYRAMEGHQPEKDALMIFLADLNYRRVYSSEFIDLNSESAWFKSCMDEIFPSYRNMPMSLQERFEFILTLFYNGKFKTQDEVKNEFALFFSGFDYDQFMDLDQGQQWSEVKFHSGSNWGGRLGVGFDLNEYLEELSEQPRPTSAAPVTTTPATPGLPYRSESRLAAAAAMEQEVLKLAQTLGEKKGWDPGDVMKRLLASPKAEFGKNLKEIRAEFGKEALGVSDAAIIVALLVGGILKLNDKDPILAAKKMTLLAVTIGGNATVALKAAFHVAYPNTTLPVTNNSGWVIDVLDVMPAKATLDAKIDAIKAMLALDLDKHYALVVPRSVDALEIRRKIVDWGKNNGVAKINERIHVEKSSMASQTTVVNRMLQLASLSLSPVVVMGKTEVVNDLSGMVSGEAKFVARGTEIKGNLDTACVVEAVRLLGTSEPDGAIQRVQGNMFRFDRDGLQAVAASLAREIQGLLSLRQAA